MALAQYISIGMLFIVIHLFLRQQNWRRRTLGHKLPPGRPGYPILGNAFEIPSVDQHLIYRQWAKEFKSDIFHLDAAGTSIVVLNNVDLAQEMLEGRSTIHSSRPQSIMLNELIGWGWAIATMPYGRKWRERRKLFQRHFSPSNIAFILPYQQEQVDNLIIKLLNSPNNFRDHIRHMVGALTISFTFGLPVQTFDDPYISVAETAVEHGSEAAVPGAFYVDFIPALRHVPDWFPGAGFKQKAKEWGAILQAMKNKPFEDGEMLIATGLTRPSFLSAALENLDLNSDDIVYQRDIIADTAGMVFAAASDTTTSSLASLFLAMMCYPKVQRRAQEELDRVLMGRIPGPQDEASLPYITAIVKEVLRWNPATPIGVPHQSDQDDIFHGYFIPKGSIIIANQWAMLHNAEDYPQPEDFNPGRFLDENGNLSNAVRDPSTIAFGFGRRICPGSHIAQSALWLATATVLSLFNISKPIKPDGEVAEPSMKYSPGLISHPVPFDCSIEPRSKRAEELIQSL